MFALKKSAWEEWRSPVIHLSAAQMYNAFRAVTKTRGPVWLLISDHLVILNLFNGQCATLQGNYLIMLNCGDLGPLHSAGIFFGTPTM